METTIRTVAAFVLTVLVIGIAGLSIAHADENSTDANVSAEATVNVRTQAKPGPLQLLHDKRMELQDKAKEEFNAARDSMKIELRTASSGAERHDITEEMQQKRDEVRGNIKERLQVLVRTHLGSVIARLTAAVRHFDNIIERMESRIDKLKNNGVDTSSIEVSLETGIELTATAQADIDALKTLIESVSADSKTDEVKAEIRAAIQKATDDVKAAHRALLETAKELVVLVRTSAEVHSDTNVDTE